MDSDCGNIPLRSSSSDCTFSTSGSSQLQRRPSKGASDTGRPNRIRSSDCANSHVLQSGDGALVGRQVGATIEQPLTKQMESPVKTENTPCDDATTQVYEKDDEFDEESFIENSSCGSSGKHAIPQLKRAHRRTHSDASVPEFGNSLFIGGLIPEITDQDLFQHFSSYGTISSLTIKSKMDPFRRFAFINYQRLEVTEQVLKQAASQGIAIKGRSLTIQLAVSKNAPNRRWQGRDHDSPKPETRGPYNKDLPSMATHSSSSPSHCQPMTAHPQPYPPFIPFMPFGHPMYYTPAPMYPTMPFYQPQPPPPMMQPSFDQGNDPCTKEQ